MTVKYEILIYPYGEDADGNHQHVDNFDRPVVKEGINVYVKEYIVKDGEDEDDAEIDVIEDEDFDTQAQADAFVAKLLVKYGEDTPVESY